MPVPDFSPGEVLTAAAMDSIGMWLVKTQTVGTAVSTVTVSDAFSANYENYKIIYNGGVASAATTVTFQLGGSTASYYAGLPRVDATGANANIASNNVSNWFYAGVGSADGISLNMELLNPFLSKFTLATFAWLDPRPDNAWGVGAGVHRVASSYSGFTVGLSGGTMTGGTIRVYGYRN